MATKRKFYILIRRVPMQGDVTRQFPTNNSYRDASGQWRRKYVTRAVMVWPVLFDTRDAAEDYMNTCFHFRRIAGRKLSAAVESTLVEDK